MAEAKEVKNSFSFVKGFISEASGLTFPEDASLDEENFDILLDGSRAKRLGLKFEKTVAENAATLSTVGEATSTYLWTGAGYANDLSILVIQTGQYLRFKNAGGPSIGRMEDSVVDLDRYKRDEDYKNIPLSFASEGNRLFFSSVSMLGMYVSADIDQPHLNLDPFKTFYIEPRIRDLEGADDGLDADVRPHDIPWPGAHWYNLQNQGWSNLKYPGGTVSIATTASGLFSYNYSGFVEVFRNSLGAYPSNSDIQSFCKISSAQAPEGVGALWPGEIFKTSLGNTPAPKGKFIMNPFDFTRPGSGEDRQTIDIGYSAVAAYAGRLCIALGNKVYFSQLITDEKSIGSFYQAADPTSEDVNALVDTDGGVIPISGASSIHQLVTFGDKLVVFAENGVWTIDGADVAFSATNFRVSKTSSTGSLSPHSAVSTDVGVIYSTPSGFYTASSDNTTGMLAASNLSQTSIQSFYVDEILPGGETLKPRYDRVTRKLYWLYNDGSNYNKYSKILILDLSLQAFSKYSIPSTSENQFITDFAETVESAIVEETFNVITSTGDTVITSGGDSVINQKSRKFSKSSSFDFLAWDLVSSVDYHLQEASFSNTAMEDWEGFGTSVGQYEAFLKTGYSLSSDLMRKKQSPIIQVAFNRSESRFVDNGSGGVTFDRPSSCLLTPSWDWTDNSISGKVGTTQEVYRFSRHFIGGGIGEPFDNGLPVVTTRTKLRGKGRAVSLEFRSPAGKDCQLLGWAVLNAGNTYV